MDVLKKFFRQALCKTGFPKETVNYINRSSKMGGFFFKKMPVRKKVGYQYYQEECLIDKKK